MDISVEEIIQHAQDAYHLGREVEQKYLSSHGIIQETVRLRITYCITGGNDFCFYDTYGQRITKWRDLSRLDKVVFRNEGSEQKEKFNRVVNLNFIENGFSKIHVVYSENGIYVLKDLESIKNWDTEKKDSYQLIVS